MASVSTACSVFCVAGSRASTPFAVEVISYEPGVGAAAGYTDPAAALGEPTRVSGVGTAFAGVVTPFQPAFAPGELVSIGLGGSLTLAFAQPVLDDPANPFGIDLLVFGNAFFLGSAAGAGLFAEGGVIEVSADGVAFVEVPGVAADGMFPTLGYSDLDNPFAVEPGDVLTEFTRPVDPALATALGGLDIHGLSLAYDGSGGGAGVDLGAVGLAAARFVRISNRSAAGLTPEIDAIADVEPVPGPCSAADVAPVFGVLDIFDIVGFFADFSAGGAAGDFNADGMLDVFDILGYFAAFGRGCGA